MSDNQIIRNDLLSLDEEFNSPALPGTGPVSSCPQCRLDAVLFHPSHSDGSTVRDDIRTCERKTSGRNS